MKLTLDILSKTLIKDDNGKTSTIDLYSKEAFDLISDHWVNLGWNQKYTYTFTWLGRPIIQFPEDLIRVQEIIYKIKPDVIIETGVAHGGSLIYYASLCKIMGKGQVIGIDIEIRPHNRKAIEEHELFEYITLIEQNSLNENVISRLKAIVKQGKKVFVMLDSNHSKEHVLNELNAYSELVSVDSYIVAADGIMENLFDTPGGQKDWAWDNPKAAVEEFISYNDSFELEEPKFLFNESSVNKRITYWPNAFLRRIK